MALRPKTSPNNDPAIIKGACIYQRKHIISSYHLMIATFVNWFLSKITSLIHQTLTAPNKSRRCKCFQPPGLLEAWVWRPCFIIEWLVVRIYPGNKHTKQQKSCANYQVVFLFFYTFVCINQKHVGPWTHSICVFRLFKCTIHFHALAHAKNGKHSAQHDVLWNVIGIFSKPYPRSIYNPKHFPLHTLLPLYHNWQNHAKSTPLQKNKQTNKQPNHLNCCCFGPRHFKSWCGESTSFWKAGRL